MEPLVVLLLLPILIGLACAMAFRDLIHGSASAALIALLAVYLCFQTLAPNGGWNWLATILVAPLASGVAMVTVLGVHLRSPARKRRRS